MSDHTSFIRPRATIERERLIELCRGIVQCRDLEVAAGSIDPRIPDDLIQELSQVSFQVNCLQAREKDALRNII
jgi:hypothetical protein